MMVFCFGEIVNNFGFCPTRRLLQKLNARCVHGCGHSLYSPLPSKSVFQGIKWGTFSSHDSPSMKQKLKKGAEGDS